MNNPPSKKWDKIEWVLTDVDDTLTWQGKLPKETLIALESLQDNNIKIIVVTGACAGWCDHIAQLWPVDAVIGENGAFTIEKQKRGVTLSTSIHINAWIGEHSKQHSAFTFLRAQGLSEPTILERCCYIGDSLNDEQMFASLPLTVGFIPK